MVAHHDREQVHAETIPAWRQWSEDNHQAADGVRLVSWKSATGKSRISYQESVVEALAVGWVDGKQVTLDQHRSAQWFAPHKPTFPPSARRAILGWIAIARTAPTRAKRVNETAERASRGERANQWPRV